MDAIPLVWDKHKNSYTVFIGIDILLAKSFAREKMQLTKYLITAGLSLVAPPSIGYIEEYVRNRIRVDPGRIKYRKYIPEVRHFGIHGTIRLSWERNSDAMVNVIRLIIGASGIAVVYFVYDPVIVLFHNPVS